ncbi:MAG: type II toxin-antitoxin system RelE/ParE family toxin [Janthinobacterium lividum]
MRQEDEAEELDDQSLRVYRLRFSDLALTEIDAVQENLTEYIGKPAADAWEKGLYDEIAKLATLPLRHPAAAEAARFRGNVRQVIYRRSNQSAYRVIFTVQEESLDGPTVAVLGLRHGAAKAITRAEAREMEAE